jgi:hypothetical protein
MPILLHLHQQLIHWHCCLPHLHHHHHFQDSLMRQLLQIRRCFLGLLFLIRHHRRYSLRRHQIRHFLGLMAHRCYLRLVHHQWQFDRQKNYWSHLLVC